MWNQPFLFYEPELMTQTKDLVIKFFEILFCSFFLGSLLVILVWTLFDVELRFFEGPDDIQYYNQRFYKQFNEKVAILIKNNSI